MTDENSIDDSIPEVKVEEGMSIWGDKECGQCGACCYEYHKYLYGIEAVDSGECENFEIKEGKAYCLTHDGERKFPLCEEYFCGDTQFIMRFRYGGDETLRGIAKKLGTVPKKHSIPKLIPK